jgi:hypothetical protein
MYRIEVVPGEETVFRTMEELAVGIRNGLITPRARIYHNASQKWLPIGLHPHYKKAMELPAASSAHPKTPPPVPAKAPSKPRVESHTVESHTVVSHTVVSHTAEHPAEPTPAPAPKVPAPVMSPVVAMQQEVLRDLPVVVIPEPLPWARRHVPVEPSAPPPAPTPEPVVPIAQPVQSQPTATVTYTPSPQPEPVQPEPVQPEPVSPWPHFEPMTEEAHARPTARRSKRAGGRPLLLVGIAAALVAAAHFALNATPSTSADSSDGAEPEEVLVSEPVAADASAEEPAVKVPPAPTAAAPPRVTSSPARVRMTPGPAFAGSVPAQPGADTVAPRAKVPVAPATSAPADPDAAAPSIAPAPVDLLALPDLKTDSIAPTRAAGDTMAMKKILRALNGSKR